MQLGRAGLEGLIHVEDRRKDLVFHVDKTKGLLGYPLAGGRHEGDCIAYKADLAVEDAKHPGRAPLPIGDVFPGKHRLDALQSPRLAAIDLLYKRMGVGAAEHFCVEEVGKLDLLVVVEELGRSP